MTSISKKNLILSLIKDDLINTKLINGLSDLGINAEDYCLHLSETIFNLAGIADTLQNEFIYEQYFEMTKRATDIDIAYGNNSLNNLAEEIYLYLLNAQGFISFKH